MRVLFLNPPFHSRFSREQRSPAVTKSGTLYYPKWLCHAAGVAIREGHDVDVVDAPASQISVQTVIDRIQTKNIQAVVCDTSTPSILNDVKVIDALYHANPKLHLLMVGRHVSAMPSETFALSSSIQALALREYEYTVRDWLAALDCGASLESVDGLVWRNTSRELVTNKARETIKDLDELPFVSEVYKRFLHIPDYFYGHSLWPLVVFDTSRGCPYKCSFCVYPQTFSGHTMRYRSKEHVADEFEFVSREMPEVKTVMLEDDTFIISRKRTMDLAKELIRRENKLRFDSNCRADVGADIELLSTLRKAGARLFCVGFESGDPEVIRGIRKNNTEARDANYHQEAKKFARLCKQADIKIHGCFMIGNLNENRESMEKTLEFAMKLKPDTAQFFPIMVYPGTESFRQASELGYISTGDWSQWLTKDGLHNSVVNLPNLTHQEMVEFCDRARRRFYLNPSYLVRKALQSLRSPGELQRNLKGFATLSKYLVRGSFGFSAGPAKSHEAKQP
jgi:anaerobic magnesium-protoporphyrin IX monomethyl ester cyclase